MKYLSYLLLPCLFLFACGNDDDMVTLEEDVQKIEDYLMENGLTAQSTDSGLHYIIEEEGNGVNPTIMDVVTVFYQGYFLDGTPFDQTGLYPVSFGLNALIEGWREGIPLLEYGGKGRLILPSQLAYGSNPPSGIPKNAILIFDIEIVEDLAVLEKEQIENYLTENNLTADTITDSGLHYVIEEEGSGTNPPSTAQVTVNYKGYFLDGTVFDESTAPATFGLDGVIDGWKEGIPLFKKGGKGTLVMPSDLAYGQNPPQGFPQNATLVFDIELVDF